MLSEKDVNVKLVHSCISHILIMLSAKKYAELHGGGGDKKKEKKEKAPKQQEPKKEKATPKKKVWGMSDCWYT